MSTVTEVREKRRSPRATIEGELRYRKIPIAMKGPGRALIQNVSQGGFKFRSDELLGRSANLLAELHFPGANPIRSLATVAWVKSLPEDNGYEIGGTLVDPTRETLSALENIIRGH